MPRTLLVFEHGCPHRRLLEQWYARRKDLPERTIELGSYHAMLGCVMTGMGAALVPHSVISTFPEKVRLRVNRLPEGQNRLKTLLIWPKNVRSAKVVALRRLLQETSANPDQCPAGRCAPDSIPDLCRADL